MGVEQFTWQSLATVPGAVAAVTLILAILKIAIGPPWTEQINKWATLALGVLVMEAAVFAIGTPAIWYNFVLAGMTGVVVAGACLGVVQSYRGKVEQDLTIAKDKAK